MTNRRPDPALDGVEIALLLLGLLLLFLFLPALVVHGTSEGGTMHWTMQTTVVCCIWWGFLLSCLIGFIASRVNSPAVRELEKELALQKGQPLKPPHQPQPLRPDLRLMWVTRFLD